MKDVFEASVLASKSLPNEHPSGATHGIVLDRSCFYPEGGGQEADYGRLSSNSASHQVWIHKIGDLIVHLTSGPFEIGDLVRAE